MSLENKLDLHGIIFAGKGGVGKSNSAGSYAAFRSDENEIAIFDHDGGHSISRVLFGNDTRYATNQFLRTSLNNVWMSILDPLKFVSVNDWKVRHKTDMLRSIDHYFAQFEDDQGYVCWNDMIMNFFGPACDISSISKFCYLTSKLYEAQEAGVKEIVVDVEPTEGMKNLLNCGVSAARSLRNLQKAGIGTLFALGLTWPDIRDFLGGEYIENADFFASRMEQAIDFLRRARYHVVTTPESSPVSQSFEVKEIIEGYGGRVFGYVVNNLRGEPHEARQIARVKDTLRGIPVVLVRHDERLCDAVETERYVALKEVGKQLSVFSKQ